MKTTVSFYIDDDLIAKIDAYKEMLEKTSGFPVSRSQAICRLLELALDRA